MQREVYLVLYGCIKLVGFFVSFLPLHYYYVVRDTGMFYFRSNTGIFPLTNIRLGCLVVTEVSNQLSPDVVDVSADREDMHTDEDV